MPNWKKVITSGSDAELNSLSVTNGVTGSLLGNALTSTSASYALTASYTPSISGTNNYISKFTGASTIGNSIIYDEEKVGIGTTTPNSILDVNGTISLKGVSMLDYDSNNDLISIGDLDAAGAAVYIIDDSGEGIYLDGTGNVGIGTAIPSSKFEVEGDISATANITSQEGLLSKYWRNNGVSTVANSNNIFTETGQGSNSITIVSNTTDSTGYVSTFGNGLYVRGINPQRDFAFYKAASFDDSRIWVGNKLTGDTWDWNRILLESDLDSYVRKTGSINETVTGLKTFSSGIKLISETNTWGSQGGLQMTNQAGQSSWMWMDDANELNIQNSSGSPRAINIGFYLSPVNVSGTLTANALVGDGSGVTNIDINNINATGSLSSSTYLRGDGTWSTISSGGGDVFKVGTPNSNRLAMWTGDGTLAHVQDLAWIQGDSTFYITGRVSSTNITTEGFDTTGTSSGGNLAANFGDYNNNNNSTSIIITDSTNSILMGDPYDLNSGVKVDIDGGNGNILIGDPNGISSNTHIDVNIASDAISIISPNTTVDGNLKLKDSLYDGTDSTGTSGQILSSKGSTVEWVDKDSQSKSISIESPSASEDISLFYTDRAITIVKLVSVLRGSATPTVSWTLRYSSSRSDTGTAIITAGTSTTSTTTGNTVTTFNNASIPANNFIWLETTAKSGTVDEINITTIFTLD